MNNLKTLIFGILLVISLASTAKAENVTIFAASSLAPALEELSLMYFQKTGIKCRCTYGASSLLAKHIYNGAPADIYISANPLWMDYLATHDALEPGNRYNLLGNSLILIAPAGSPLPPGKPTTFPEGKLAISDPAHVPAGIYAKSALQSLDLWQNLKSQTIRTSDARTTLALVLRGEVMAGVVYASDVYNKPENIKVIYKFPTNLHETIIYPASIVKDRNQGDVSAYYEFLKSREARSLFNRYGFTSIGDIGSQ